MHMHFLNDTFRILDEYLPCFQRLQQKRYVYALKHNTIEKDNTSDTVVIGPLTFELLTLLIVIDRVIVIASKSYHFDNCIFHFAERYDE
jgi:hypothetical protein